jgi:hypothetical protein
MLKITVLDGGAGQSLKVEGKLAEPWVSELELAWNPIRQERPNGHIIVDLNEMTYMDPKGKAVLMAMIGDGARLIAKGVYYGYLVEQLMEKAQKEEACRRRRNGAGARHSASAH